MSDRGETLFERIGGAPAIEEMVGEFYRRVLADPELGPFFENTPIEKLTRMQREFFGAAFDGPMTVGGTDLAEIHHGMGITRRHLTGFVDHLIDVVDERHGIGRRDAMDVIHRIAMFGDRVLGDTSIDG